MDKIISFGGGVNSVAMVIMLYKRGEIYPCVFADTMAEHPETYCYMDYFEREFMGQYGQKIVRLSPITTPDYYEPANKGLSIYQWFWDKKFVPMPMQSACSKQYKRTPLSRYAPKPHIIGFALDESHRANRNEFYPLIESRIDRQGCVEIIKHEGLNVPRKSGCFICSMQRVSQWEDLYKHYPELFQKAMDLEQNSHLTILQKPLSYLKARFDGKGGELFPDYDYEELTPCMCIT